MHMKMRVCIYLLFFSLLLVSCDATCENCHQMYPGDEYYVSCIDENAVIQIETRKDNIVTVWCE